MVDNLFFTFFVSFMVDRMCFHWVVNMGDV
jgi:hypothetical protein